MIPNSSPDIRARFRERDRDDDNNYVGASRYFSLPVIAWDRDGNALVPGPCGRLTTAYGLAEDNTENMAAKTDFMGLDADERPDHLAQ